MSEATEIELEYPPILPIPNTSDIEEVVAAFKNRFTGEPDFVARAPGRVNLIGEHIDYCGYSVCPMAIQQHILVAFRSRNDSSINIINSDDNYKDYVGDVSDVSISLNGQPCWYQYFLCGVKGVLHLVPKDTTITGFDAVVLGNIPPSAGLSSSSALVCASTLALAHAYELKLPKNKLADAAAMCERFIGTEGGGMDQAISFMASPGCAKLISFNPLKAEELRLPEGAVFVIANSLVQMNKAATADFNQRVVECRLSCQLMAKRLRLDWRKYTKVVTLQRALGLGARHLRALAVETFHDQPYKKDELCREFQVTEEELDKVSLTENTRHIKEFKLKQRLLHVVQEVERVQEFVRHCKEADTGKEKPGTSLWHLGDLMKQSHASLKNLYECSHEELDRIVELADGVTLGARLTGAGWGGCTVALTTTDKAPLYIQKLKNEFYSTNNAAVDKNLDILVFATQPGPGACVYVKQPE